MPDAINTDRRHVINTRDDQDPARLERGKAEFEKIYGPGASERFLADRAGLGEDLARFGLEFNFGDINSRPTLSLAQRELATIATLIGIGGADPQIAGHTKAALIVGLTPQEIVEVVIHCVQFVGFPRALNALAVVKSALAEAGVDVNDPNAPPLARSPSEAAD